MTKGKSKKVVLKLMEDLGPDWLSVIPVVGGFAALGLKTAMLVKKEFSSASDQITMFQRYTKTLQNISKKNPLLLIVDDLQWSDDSSCGLLFHLARNIDEYPIFIIGIYRPSEIEATSHPIKQIRAEMDRYKICNELSLKRLSKEKLIEYLNAEFPNNKFEAPFIDVLNDKTDGNAFYMIEAIQLLKEQKTIIKEDKSWKLSKNIKDIDIPRGVAGVIAKRISLLKDESRRILEYASIEGENFASITVSKLLNWDELPLVQELRLLGKINKLIEELELEGLTRKKGGEYEFIQHFVHKSFYDGLGKREKELLHKKIGEILEELYKEDIHEIVVDLAVHFERGRVYNKSVDYRLKSAIKANDIHSCTEAIAHCNKALSLLEKTKDEIEENIKKKTELLFELGRGEEFIGEWVKAIEHYTEAKKHAEKTDTEIYISEGFLRTGRILRKRGEYRDSIDNLKKSVEIKTKINDGKGLAETLSELGYIYSRQKKFTNALSKLQDCLTINKKQHDYIGMARTLRTIGFIYRRQHKFTEAHKALSASVKYCTKANSVQEKAETLREMAVIYGEQGNHEEELLVCDEILRIDEELGNIVGKIHTLKRQSWANRLLGNLSKAVAISEERLKIAKKTGNLHEIAEALQGVALLYRDIGKWEESINYCKEYIKIADELGAVPRHTIYNDLGFVYRRQGKFDSAIKSFEKEIELETKMDDKTRKMWLTEIGKVYFYQGKLDKALSLYEEALEVASGRQKTSIFWKMGEIYEEKNLLDTALDNYSECLKSIKEQNDILRAPVILTKIGGVYLLQGKYEISQQTLEEALKKHCGEKHGEAITYHSLSKLHFTKGELKKAMKYIDKAIEIFNRLKAFRVVGSKLTKARIYLKNKEYQNASKFIRIAREKFTEFRIPHGVAETKMLEGELIYAETGNSKRAHSLILKAAEIFRNLGFKLLENEAARITKTISSKGRL
ncbi:MAG TPA: tetratricopeptide repeat protein [Candidatus Scalindua sp.]|nr:tetratricopeptide repeat protein [Candidatus Scalindua sp.]